MRYGIILLVFIVILFILEWQITSVTTQQRRNKCRVVVTYEGTRKATDYEYYKCLSK